MLGLGTDDAIDQRIKDAIANLLAKQNSAGGFGLWGPDSGDPWLDAYVTDFLLRAKAEGYEVPGAGHDHGARQPRQPGRLRQPTSTRAARTSPTRSTTWRGPAGPPSATCATISKRGSTISAPRSPRPSSVRRSPSMATARRRRNRLRRRRRRSQRREAQYRYRIDYGSQLRDTAAVLALAAEFKPSGIDLAATHQKLSGLRDNGQLDLDAGGCLDAAGGRRSAAMRPTAAVTIDGEALGRFGLSPLRPGSCSTGTPSPSSTTATRPTEMKVSVTGIPRTPPPAAERRLHHQPDYYLPDGTPADLSQRHAERPFRRGADRGHDHAGLRPVRGGRPAARPDSRSRTPISLQGSGVAGSLSGSRVDRPAISKRGPTSSSRPSASPRRRPAFTTAYLVRAVTPGSFVLPGATVEDMYRPELRANTDAGQIEVAAAGRSGRRQRRPDASTRACSSGMMAGRRRWCSSSWHGAAWWPASYGLAVLRDVAPRSRRRPTAATLPVSTAVVDRDGQLLRPFTTTDGGRWRLPVEHGRRGPVGSSTC